MFLFLNTKKHDSVLKSIVSFVHSKLRPGFSLFSDLTGFQSPHGGVIPPYILVTPLRPDIFLVNDQSKEVVLFELTCPWERNIDTSHEYKENKYAPIVADISRNYRVFHFSVEVSARGQVTNSNRNRLKQFVFRCCDDARTLGKPLTEKSSKAALLASYSLFCARKEPSWTKPSPLIVR